MQRSQARGELQGDGQEGRRCPDLTGGPQAGHGRNAHQAQCHAKKSALAKSDKVTLRARARGANEPVKTAVWNSARAVKFTEVSHAQQQEIFALHKAK